mmetsp:Transcript_31251/g.89611  ORF Transcript_31251/g.89611 Transcript_31251/m.89611 type:complete len:132 (-) Transcript_31251:167-562(-)
MTMCLIAFASDGSSSAHFTFDILASQSTWVSPLTAIPVHKTFKAEMYVAMYQNASPQAAPRVNPTGAIIDANTTTTRSKFHRKCELNGFDDTLSMLRPSKLNFLLMELSLLPASDRVDLVPVTEARATTEA